MLLRKCQRPERIGYAAMPRILSVWRVVEVESFDKFRADPDDFIYTTTGPATPARNRKKLVAAKIERDGKEQTVLVEMYFNEDNRASPTPESGLEGQPFEIIGFFFAHTSSAGVPDPQPLQLHAQ